MIARFSSSPWSAFARLATLSMAVQSALTLLLMLVSPAGAVAQGRVTVRSGDALSLLAERFGVSVADLRAWNELEGDQIQVGQELVVAGADSAAAGSEDASATGGPVYEVSAGDNLSSIAQRFEVSIDEILGWNDGLRADAIRVGQRLVIGTPRHRVEHRVRSGESLSRIAARYEVSVRDLRRWNRALGRRMLRADETIVLWSERPESRSESVGVPHGGRLIHGERLPRHAGYVIRDRDSAYGTRETNDAIVEAFDAVVASHRRAPKLRVHDLSAQRGGRMSGHRSHQNGRDADISYFHRRGCPADGCGFRRLSPNDLDAERTWTLLHAWLAKDQAHAIFIDYSLQRPLYQEARRQGATREELHRWFQFPRGVGFPLGVIRHFPQHRDHLHVRFRCAEGDDECR
ncbi:MAG: hypothetical protein DRJ42_22505 [Deltaproteobacteria bacterium]|nr:MAG: hypothetical protein DRJ42_22505 [Deltaproteobacteria bacterium]